MPPDIPFSAGVRSSTDMETVSQRTYLWPGCRAQVNRHQCGCQKKIAMVLHALHFYPIAVCCIAPAITFDMCHVRYQII